MSHIDIDPDWTRRVHDDSQLVEERMAVALAKDAIVGLTQALAERFLSDAELDSALSKAPI